MKKLLLRTLFAAQMLIVGTLAAQAEAYVLWCEGNTTLYFLSSDETLTAGGTHDGQTITNVWHGDEVAVQRTSEPVWEKVAKNTLTRVVFEESFKTVKPTSFYEWFSGCLNLKSVEGLSEGYLDTSNAWTMYRMFSGCQNLTSLDVSKFDTGEVTNMAGLFQGCSKVASLDLSHFNTSKVFNMAGMFTNCDALTTLDVSSFNTSQVTNMIGMFSGCLGLTSLDLSNFDTHNVTDMTEMFRACLIMTSFDLSSFDTSNVTEMSRMFYRCEKLSSLDLSSFNTSKVTTLPTMFAWCNELTAVYVGKSWDMSNVEYSDDMFSQCKKIVGEDGTTYDDNAIDKTKAHYGAGGYLRYKDAAGIISIERNDKDCRYYDLRGHRVKRPAKGVYIVDGRKVVME